MFQSTVLNLKLKGHYLHVLMFSLSYPSRPRYQSSGFIELGGHRLEAATEDLCVLYDFDKEGEGRYDAHSDGQVWHLEDYFIHCLFFLNCIGPMIIFLDSFFAKKILYTVGHMLCHPC